MTEAEAAVAIVHARGPRESVLLMRRAERKSDSWSGHWAFPGGRRDAGDADLLATALRELEEECGVRLARADLEAELPARHARRKAGAYVQVTPFVFRTAGELAAVPDAIEAAEAIWLPLDAPRDPARHLLLPIPGLPREMRYPGIELPGGPLWGFTYRLICDWLGLEAAAGRTGLEGASLVLDFLLAHGLTLMRGWMKEGHARAARVRGAIPVDAVLERFAGPGRHVHSINCLEVRPDRIHIAGPLFEDYFIYAGGSAV
jgi:8-oxo-dGTP pyrophosphatase MutT (NUDIX family)